MGERDDKTQAPDARKKNYCRPFDICAKGYRMARRQGRGARKISRAKATIDQLPQITEIFLKIKEGHTPNMDTDKTSHNRTKAAESKPPGSKVLKMRGPYIDRRPNYPSEFFCFPRATPRGAGGGKMNINRLIRTAAAKGYEVTVDRDGRQYAYTIHDANIEVNKDIHTDRHGLELFILYGPDAYLAYCENAGIEAFC